MFKNWFGKSEEEPEKPKRKNTERLFHRCKSCERSLCVADLRVEEIPPSAYHGVWKRGNFRTFYKCPTCQREAYFGGPHLREKNRFEEAYSLALRERAKLRYAGFDEDILPETFKSFDLRLIEIASEQAIAVSLAAWENEDVSD